MFNYLKNNYKKFLRKIFMKDFENVSIIWFHYAQTFGTIDR